MGDPFLTLKFAQSLGQQKPLTQLGAGIAQIHDTWKQADAQKQIGQAYDNSFQQYMQDPSAEKKAQLLQVAQRAGNYDETISTIGQVEQQRAAEAEAARIAELEADYKKRLSKFTKDQTPDNLFAAAQAAQELGRLDEHNTMVESYTAEQRRNTVQQYLGVYSLLESNNGKVALETAERYGEAYERSGNKMASELWYQVAQHIEDGDITGAKSFIAIHAATMEEGREAFKEGVYPLYQEERDQAAEERAAEDHVADFIERGQDVIGTRAELDAMEEYARSNPEFTDTWLKVLNFARLAQDGMAVDPTEAVDAYTTLRKEWRDGRQRLDGVMQANASMANIYDDIRRGASTGTGYYNSETGEIVEKGHINAQPMEMAGIHDLAMINMFQRQIDPATVRKDDFDNIIASNPIMGQLDLLRAKIMAGDRLTPEQREQMMNASTSMNQAQQDFVDAEIYPAIRATVDALGRAGVSVESPGGGLDLVFGPEYVHPEQRLAMREERDRLRAEKAAIIGQFFPNGPQNDEQRKIEAEINAVGSTSELQKMYPNRYGTIGAAGSTGGAGSGADDDEDLMPPEELTQDEVSGLQEYIITNHAGLTETQKAFIRQQPAQWHYENNSGYYRAYTNKLDDEVQARIDAAVEVDLDG